MNQPQYHPETLALHAGLSKISDTQAQAVPVYRTTAYHFKSAAHSAALFSLSESGNSYARFLNPTNDVLEQRLTALENGAAAVTFSSGTAAIYFTVTNILKEGDELLASRELYGGTYTQFDAILPQQGIKVNFTPINDFKLAEAAITPRTRAIYIETISNPGLEVADIEGYAKIAAKHHLPLIVDATFTPPTLLRPLDYGADIVIHSLSKWIGGHGTLIGGAVIDGGKFDWSDPKFDLYNNPDRGYHQLRFGHDLGDLSPVAFAVRLRTVSLRNLGPTLSPDSAWMALQGVETLSLRMERHSANALAVAQFLAEHPKVAWVRYPGLKPGDNERKYLKNGFGGIVAIGVKGGRSAAETVVDHIPLFSHVANVGDARSLIIHPASTTHSQLSDEAIKACGIAPEMLRLSIGLEHIDDIKAALDEVLSRI